jgi:hypothetical protein
VRQQVAHRSRYIVDFAGIDEVGAAELQRDVLLRRVGVDDDDARRLFDAQRLDRGQADAARPEHRCSLTGLDVSKVEHRAETRDHTARDETRGRQGNVVGNRYRLDLFDHRDLGE